MIAARIALVLAILSVVVMFSACKKSAERHVDEPRNFAAGDWRAQTPKWSIAEQRAFFHGTISAEFIPARVYKAFVAVYPDLFPEGIASYGLLKDPQSEWPIGLSQRKVEHLGGLPSLGINCASCHTAEIQRADGPSVRVLGAAGNFDGEAFFGAIADSTYRCADPEQMNKFLKAYIGGGRELDPLFAKQADAIRAEVAADSAGNKGIATPDAMHSLKESDLNPDSKNLAGLAGNILKLFHNMRAALHLPDDRPQDQPSVSGPGRSDPWGLLTVSLFGVQLGYAPVKNGLIWNLSDRPWVHCDGNSRSQIQRNLLASLGLGVPLHGKHPALDFKDIEYMTKLTEQIRAPKYPWSIDQSAAERGAAHYAAHCASCHDGPETDQRLHAPADIGTDPARAKYLDENVVGLLAKFLSELEIKGYVPPKETVIRPTQKYRAAALAGVWARAPYLHNGSVRTIWELLTPPDDREKSHHRGSRVYDAKNLGYTDSGAYVLDCSKPGNSNGGHNYGTHLADAEKRDLIEYLKTK